MKRFFAMAAALYLLLALFPVTAQAVESGTWGENMTWRFDGETLTISGAGKMDDCAEGAPWHTYRQQVKKLVLTGGITYIGANAFTDFDALTEIDFGDKLHEVGKQAFSGCDGLVDITMPASFKIFGEEAFRGCKNLKTITCLGRFPSFRLNCLWDVYVKILYPAENNWPVSEVQNLEKAFKGRIEFLTTDGTDPNPPQDPTTAPETTPQTTPEPTTPPTTPAPETTPGPTETVPVPTLPPQTTPELTAPPETTPAPTEPVPDAPQGKARDRWLGAAIILAVLSLGGMGAGLVTLSKNSRRRRRRNRR